MLCFSGTFIFPQSATKQHGRERPATCVDIVEDYETVSLSDNMQPVAQQKFRKIREENASFFPTAPPHFPQFPFSTRVVPPGKEGGDGEEMASPKTV